MLRINVSALTSKIDAYVTEYYALKHKPVIKEADEENKWINDMVRKHVEYAIINIELGGLERIDVSERVKATVPFLERWTATKSSCVRKRGYEIDRALDGKGYKLSSKFLLKGGAKTAKVEMISMWSYKQKDEMKSVINNEFKICKKAEELGIGPKTYDAFICRNGADKRAFKVVITEYVEGMPLEAWIAEEPPTTERDVVYDLVQHKVALMHENGIIHNALSASNIILKMDKSKKSKVVDAFITDYMNAYDVKDKSMWDYNKWIRDDRNILDTIKDSARSYSNSDDVVNYVAMQLIANKNIIIY